MILDSHTIARLEAGLGVRLFNRTTRSVSLTDAGRRFIEGMAPALQDIDAAIAAARDQRDTPSGLLRINVAASSADAVLSPLVIEFLKLYPQMEVDIVTEVSNLADITKVKAEVAVDAVFDAMRASMMRGERIELRGFGVFQVKPRKRGIGRNPRTGKEVRIPPGRTIRFKPGKELQNIGG